MTTGMLTPSPFSSSFSSSSWPSSSYFSSSSLGPTTDVELVEKNNMTRPEHPNILNIPNVFSYEHGMWYARFLLPLALILQTVGHVLVIRLYHKQKTRLKCDSRIFLFNYVLSDTIFVLYIVITFSLDTVACSVVQVLYGTSITLPIYAVCLITFKRFVRVTRPLRCSSIVTSNREMGLVAASWLVVLGVALLSLCNWCEVAINLNINYCYYRQDDMAPACRAYIGVLVLTNFCLPLSGVLLMYFIMLRESRKAFQMEAFVSVLNMNRYAPTPHLNTLIAASRDVNMKTRDVTMTTRDVVMTTNADKMVVNVNITNNITVNNVPVTRSRRSSTKCNVATTAGDVTITTGDVTMTTGDNLAPPDSTENTAETEREVSTPSAASRSNVSSREGADNYHIAYPTKEFIQVKRMSDTRQISIHGTIFIILFCFLIRSLPWIPQLLAPQIFEEKSDKLGLVEAMTLLQYIGISTCPYIFVLTTTTRIRKFLFRTFGALVSFKFNLSTARRPSRITPLPAGLTVLPCETKQRSC